MQVFEVVELEEQSIVGLPGWSLTRERRRWIARDPEGNVRATGRVRGNVEASAQEYAARGSSATPSDTEQPRDSERRGSNTRRANRNPVADPDQRSAVDRGDSERGRNQPVVNRDPSGRIEPTIDTEPNVRNANPTPTGDMRALHPDVPDYDSLNRRERRAYNRGESFERTVRRMNGTGTMRLTITPDMVDEQTRIRSGTTGLQARDRNPSVDTDVDGDVPSKGIMGKVWDAISGSRVVKVLKAVFGTTGAAAINAAINASAVEDALDAFMRAVKEEANNVSESERQAFLSSIASGNFPPNVLRAWGESVERFNQLMVEAIISVILGGGWVAYVLLTGFSIGTGFVGGVLSLIAGGAFVVGGTMALYSLLESVGVNDIVENKITSKIFNPQVVLGTAMTVDGIQEYFGTSLDWLTGWTGWSAGDLVRDSISYDSAMLEESGNGAVTSNQAKQIVKNFIKSDPKLVKAYNDGKEEAKEIMRSGAPDEESD